MDALNKNFNLYEGTQEQYDNLAGDASLMAENAGSLFKVTEERGDAKIKKIYIGDNLVGDAYCSDIPTILAKTNRTVGGIKAGTSFLSIINASEGRISKLMDTILFGEQEYEIEDITPGYLKQ